MRVLILVADLYKTVGGGQTVYRKIIAANRGIDFVYFGVDEPIGSSRPPNAKCVPLARRRDLRASQLFFPQTRLNNLAVADAFARSVAGQYFDVIELPDYFPLGSYLRDCLKVHGVQFGGLTLSMHGNISRSINLGWNMEGDSTLVERQLEYEQFVDVDSRYGFSKRYLADWQAKAPMEVHYLDPLAIVGPPTPVRWVRGANAPELYCIGRMERLKGNDLFVEIVRWLDRNLYSRACHVGAIDYARDGTSSRSILENIAQRREVNIGFLPAQGAAGLNSIFARDAMVMLPVRYDSLNLIAIEALFAGCPVMISAAAGVCDYLDERLPNVPYVKLELGNFHGVVREIERLLLDYGSYRQRLNDTIAQLQIDIPSADLTHFYKETVRKGGRASPVSAHRIQYQEDRPTIRDRMKAAQRTILPGVVRRAVGSLMRDRKGVLTGALLSLAQVDDPALAWHAREGVKHGSRFYGINLYPESSHKLVAEKIGAIQHLATSVVFRCNVWGELARLERLRGNELVAVAYELRLMRLLGGDRFGRLDSVVTSLEQHGFVSEARACEALFAAPEDAAGHVYSYLKNAYDRCLNNEARSYERLDDRRSGTPRVSVIVSLYNAHTKLKLFLTMLSLQTLVRKGAVEIILVDSGSKGNEYEVTSEFLAQHGLNIAYVRSAQRETIQAAWNRGIHLSRAPYLVFLGVDEALYPEALETLAEVLDSNSDIDWVMGNSLVTEVDERGVYQRDVMPYNRAGGTKDHTYLETCYLNWVGGMYRKSIHERFGYYDETFRAAGDTEFKSRVLPHIQVKFLPHMLGLFLNYPENRTTAGPVAEIEDSRAWYLHRTLGGVRYAFEKRDPVDVAALFYVALGYRKSYCQHISSDIEYAAHLADYLASTSDASIPPPVQHDLQRLLDAMRRLEWTESHFRALTPAAVIAKAWKVARKMERKHANLLEGAASPTYKILNDNRYEQHSWLWMTGE